MLIFFLALVETQVDWPGQARSHGEAKNRLFELKLRYRAKSVEQHSAAELGAVSSAYLSTMQTLPPIPDRLFIHFKAKHCRKVRISQLLDTNPFSCIWIAKLKFWWADTLSHPGTPNNKSDSSDGREDHS